MVLRLLCMEDASSGFCNFFIKWFGVDISLMVIASSKANSMIISSNASSMIISSGASNVIISSEAIGMIISLETSSI